MKLICISIVFAVTLLHLSCASPLWHKDHERSIEGTTECVVIVGVKKVKEGVAKHVNNVKDSIHSGLGFLKGGLFGKKQKSEPVQPHREQPEDEYKGLDYAIDVRMSPDDTEAVERQKRDASSNEEVTNEHDKQGKKDKVEEVIDAANNEDSSEKKDIQRSILAAPLNKKALIGGKYRNLIYFK